MRIKITEPLTKTELHLDARPEDYNGEQGWRILFPEKDSFVIVQKDGEWSVMDENDINPQLIDAIGKSLHPVARYNSL
ncbi:MAG TPA: hypothetical protein VLZ28_02400 [Daejeonella sp.]|nr:hypothetical protein [Daejeonella sp.]